MVHAPCVGDIHCGVSHSNEETSEDMRRQKLL